MSAHFCPYCRRVNEGWCEGLGECLWAHHDTEATREEARVLGLMVYGDAEAGDDAQERTGTPARQRGTT